LRKSGTSIKDEDHFKLPVTSTVISNVRGKSILNTKNERRDFVEHENPYRASHKDSANQVKISNTLKIKNNNGEVETVEMQNLKIKAKNSQSPLKVN
jgi:hypothetical protein